MKRSLTGITPSGDVHVGNYLGAMRPAIAKQYDYECLYFMADMHTLTKVKDAPRARKLTYDCFASWLAVGFDHKKNIIYRQSDLPMVTELAWYLSCCTGMGLLEKAHAYKDAVAQHKEVNHGYLAYPVLMAADIVMYDADIVPVGKDQKQHIELARDMAGSFNALFGEGILKLPEASIEENVMSIPGLDGRKMSKSYDNVIPLFADEKTLRQKILSIKTDSTALEAPKSVKGSLIGELYAHFTSPEQFSDLEARMQKGGMGWGHAKQELFEAINNHLKEMRVSYNELRADETLMESILKTGAERAAEIGLKVLARVREAVGYRSLAYKLVG